MNKLLTLASSALLSAATMTASAETYQVSGSFDAPSALLVTLTGTQLVQSGGLTFSGSMNTDSDSPGYNVTGGTIGMNGTIILNLNGGLPIEFSGISGTPTNAGVVFDSGTICIGGPGCPAGETILSPGGDVLLFDGSATWGNVIAPFTTEGLSLTGGAGGASFTVSQPGLPVTGSEGVGGATLFGNSAAIFLAGELSFSVPPIGIPTPPIGIPTPPPVRGIPTLPIYGLGMTILGLILIAARRVRKLKLIK
ncbi:MAG: hypothetical protein V7746_12795 [Halioglobus sp.]